VRLLNYSNLPAEAITIRIHANFKTARLYMPEAAPTDLAVSSAEGETEISIPNLPAWGGVLLQEMAVTLPESFCCGLALFCIVPFLLY
jgi:hypothetical protein